MAKQTNINSIIQKQVNNFHAGPKTESKSETGSFKLTASQKIALKHFVLPGIPGVMRYTWQLKKTTRVYPGTTKKKKCIHERKQQHTGNHHLLQSGRSL
ncbi:MAG: hypothetical protein RBS34_11675 [Desulfofustis sp.]|nr:hypothetical protein [Desulfofustis sp.]